VTMRDYITKTPYELHDPLVRDLNAAVSQVKQARQPGGHFAGAKFLAPVIEKMTALNSVIIAMNFNGFPLALALDSFNDFKRIYSDTLEAYRGMLKRTKSERNKRLLQHHLTKLQYRYDILLSLAPKVTESHLVLQTHFISISSPALRNHALDRHSVDDFLIRLAALRDDYFYDSKTETLLEYLKVMKELEAIGYYDMEALAQSYAAVSIDAHARIQDLELELEVLTMTKELM
jgi:hypothetical protein